MKMSLFKLVVVSLVATAMIVLGIEEYKASDSFVSEHVVQLRGEKGGACTGVKIRMPKNQFAVLTAAHCKGLIDVGQIKAEDHSHVVKYLKVIKIDVMSDLMLLEAYDNSGLEIGKDLEMHDRIHTITHGSAFPRHRSDGEVLHETTGRFLVGIVSSEEDRQTCEKDPKAEVVDYGFTQVCVIKLVSVVTTAKVVRGSSGGPMLNRMGQVVGIVTGGNQEGFSYMVRLQDIKRFVLENAI